ncbi:hypothetical protein PybrP1_010322 [[Pythium] brassicae (nom. inval.)]|nr:hypothetical protein PybrP1_010322 [[Pythium] brassicae (nom. inval.)]
MATTTSSSDKGEGDLELTELDGADQEEEEAPQQQQQEQHKTTSPATSPPRGKKQQQPRSEMGLLEETRFIENQKELVALQRLDDKCTQLQQEGKYTEALECMEKGLVLRQHFFGADSQDVWDSCKTVGEMCNLLAMTYLQQEEFPVVLELLKKAEILTEKHPAGRAVTLNNFACYFRRQGNLHKALTYLTEAIKIETKLDNIPNKADTHLNMCAVLSQLGKHQSALGHAQSALILLHEELQLGRGASGKSPPKHGRNNNNNNNSHHHGEGSAGLDPAKFDRIAVLGIAYHNVGVEQEFLKCYDQSLQSYKKGVDVTSRHLGEAHGIVITLQNSLITAKRHVAAKARTDGRTGDGISGLAKRPNRFAQLKSSLKSTLGKKKGGAAADSSSGGSSSFKLSLPSLRSQHSRIATEG